MSGFIEIPNTVPILASSKWNELVPLDIWPTPDSLIRIYMVFRGLQHPVEIEPQDLGSVERTGFTVVEWGGSEI